MSHGEDVVILQDDVVAIPSHRARNMEKDLRLALELGGGPAYSRSGGIERRFRDVHGALYHPLPAAQQEMFTGEQAL